MGTKIGKRKTISTGRASNRGSAGGLEKCSLRRMEAAGEKKNLMGLQLGRKEEGGRKGGPDQKKLL